MEFKTFPTNFNKTLNALLTCLLLYSCTKQSLFEKAAYVFPGIGEAAIQNDGSLILSWEQVPSDPVSYSVYRRNKTEEFNWNKALEAVSTTTYKHPAYDLSTRYCFAVHFVQVGIDNDTNTEDICPDLPYVDGFIGIANVTSTETGTALITWEKPTTGADQVANYRVYVGTDFKSSVASAAPDATSITVTGLTPEELYTFGVRAVDKYGREDANTLTRQVTIINNSAPTFSGLTSAKKASASSVTLSWAAADGRPKEYRIYKGTGASGATPTVDVETALSTVAVSNTSTTISSLGDELTHCFLVRAASSGGQEDANQISKCVTLPDNGAPQFAGIKAVSLALSLLVRQEEEQVFTLVVQVAVSFVLT